MPAPLARLGFAVLLLMAATGCARHRLLDPAFPVTIAQANDQLNHFRKHRVSLERPLVLVGGFLDPFVGEALLRRAFGKHLDAAAPHRGVSFVAWDSFESCRRKLIERVQRAWPSDDPRWTTEVDVVAFSMGGLVARHAALPPPRSASGDAGGPPRRLKIRRLFTIATPHRGANWARLGVFNPLAQSMRAGSAFLKRLDAALPAAGYDLLPYVRRGDWIVGDRRAAGPRGVVGRGASAAVFSPASDRRPPDSRRRAAPTRRAAGLGPPSRRSGRGGVHLDGLIGEPNL